eukprot:GHVU01017848.1.p2 GENE.GHVU01017848.1~~GHVU01017848.1.p2  ORF type:complete len:135 (-),score=21.38 GHVU01017848.1:611-1015(-)
MMIIVTITDIVTFGAIPSISARVIIISIKSDVCTDGAYDENDDNNDNTLCGSIPLPIPPTYFLSPLPFWKSSRWRPHTHTHTVRPSHEDFKLRQERVKLRTCAKQPPPSLHASMMDHHPGRVAASSFGSYMLRS